MCDDIEYVWCQAEDGIRDWTVTGVQTCALPISRIARFRSDRAVLDRAERAQAQYAAQLPARRPDLNLAILAHTHRPALRSAERRAGKESRSRWSPYHSTQKTSTTRSPRAPSTTS